MTEEVFEDLRRSMEDGTFVAILVSGCKYRCCGGGWGDRDYPETYRGRVLALSSEEVLLQMDNPLGKVAEVIVPLANLLSVEIVD